MCGRQYTAADGPTTGSSSHRRGHRRVAKQPLTPPSRPTAATFHPFRNSPPAPATASHSMNGKRSNYSTISNTYQQDSTDFQPGSYWELQSFCKPTAHLFNVSIACIRLLRSPTTHTSSFRPVTSTRGPPRSTISKRGHEPTT
jgi:hypothetical protein